MTAVPAVVRSDPRYVQHADAQDLAAEVIEAWSIEGVHWSHGGPAAPMTTSTGRRPSA